MTHMTFESLSKSMPLFRLVSTLSRAPSQPPVWNDWKLGDNHR